MRESTSHSSRVRHAPRFRFTGPSEKPLCEYREMCIRDRIQIGGLGVVTVVASFALLSGRRISLMQRSTMQDAISAPKVGGIVRLTRFILRGTFLIELIGALAMLPVFCRDYGWCGIWMAVFHSCLLYTSRCV